MSEIFRPDEVDAKSGGSDSFIGIMPVKIIGIVNNPHQFDDDDVNLAVELQVENSEYNRMLYITGPFNFDGDGNIEYHVFMKKMYNLFDAIGFKGGLDLKGKFVDEEGQEISDIGAYLSAKYASTIHDALFPYVAFIYKRANKAGHKYDFSYTVYPKLFVNSANGKKDLAGLVKFLRSKSVIKEYNGATPQGDVIQESLGSESTITNL